MSEEAPTYQVNPPITKRRKAPTPAAPKEPRKVALPTGPERDLPAPPSLTKWADDDLRRAELLNALRQPIIQEALATLRAAYESEIPSYVSGKSGATVIPNAADLNNLLALRSSHRAGFFGAFNALENLTREKVLRRSNTNPWGDLVPEA
jgi:hypothetical protein